MNLKHFIVKNYNDLTQHSYVTKKCASSDEGVWTQLPCKTQMRSEEGNRMHV